MRTLIGLLALCGFARAQESRPDSAVTAPARIVAVPYAFSVVPPEGWKVISGPDASPAANNPWFLVLEGEHSASLAIGMMIARHERFPQRDARGVAEHNASLHKPPGRVVEAKNLRLGGEEANIFVEASTSDRGKGSEGHSLVCLVHTESGTFEFQVNGAAEDVARHRAALEKCFASVRVGAWAIPGARIRHATFPLSLVPPDGMRELPSTLGVCLIAVPTQEKHRLELSITAQPAQRDASATKYRSSVLAAAWKSFKDVSCVDGKSLVIAGRKALLLRCKYRDGGVPVTEVHWLIPGEPRSYAIVWRCREADLGAAQGAIDACASTIEIGTEPTPAKR